MCPVSLNVCAVQYSESIEYEDSDEADDIVQASKVLVRSALASSIGPEHTWHMTLHGDFAQSAFSRPGMLPTTQYYMKLSIEENRLRQHKHHLLCGLPLQTKAAVKAHTDQQAALGVSRSPGQPAELQQQRSEGLQSPESSVSPGSPGLSLSVPSSANRKIFPGRNIKQHA